MFDVGDIEHSKLRASKLGRPTVALSKLELSKFGQLDILTSRTFKIEFLKIEKYEFGGTIDNLGFWETSGTHLGEPIGAAVRAPPLRNRVRILYRYAQLGHNQNILIIIVYVRQLKLVT